MEQATGQCSRNERRHSAGLGVQVLRSRCKGRAWARRGIGTPKGRIALGRQTGDWHSMGFSQVRTASPDGHACGVHGPPLSHSAFVHAWYRCAPVMHVAMQVAEIPCVVTWMQQTLPPRQSAFSSHCWTAPRKQNDPLASDPHVCAATAATAAGAGVGVASDPAAAAPAASADRASEPAPNARADHRKPCQTRHGGAPTDSLPHDGARGHAPRARFTTTQTRRSAQAVRDVPCTSPPIRRILQGMHDASGVRT